MIPTPEDMIPTPEDVVTVPTLQEAAGKERKKVHQRKKEIVITSCSYCYCTYRTTVSIYVATSFWGSKVHKLLLLWL